MAISYKIEMKKFRFVCSGCFLLFIGCSVAAFLAKQPWAGLGLLAFSALSVYAALGAGSFSIDRRGVTHKSYWGHWEIAWNEVVEADFSPSGTLLLRGQNKRFVLTSTEWWSCEYREDAIALVREMLDERKIVPRPSNLADCKTMKNTRVQKIAV
ncbi:hypothetical protein [Uliginosibacterium sp. TH139]|uniref:hypothetical protein n=1 Tax=Uliginosibacterium sp. TH139 TaxID=2067453 RepID=UPI001180D8D2|nr:hypothetical protein [Uliginosibacterium sp. TH139]